MKEKESADYIFEFTKKNSYVLNFYTHNVKLEDVDVGLKISATEEWDPKKGKTFTIDKQSDVLLLDDVADEVCSNAA